MEYDSLYDRTPSRSPDNTPRNIAATAKSLISQFMAMSQNQRTKANANASANTNANANANAASGKRKESEPRSEIQVVVPVLDRDHAAEYEHLSGHDSVEEVLSSMIGVEGNDEVYETRLKSGDIEWYPTAKLIGLRHGWRALAAFQQRSPSPSQSSSEEIDVESPQNHRSRRTRTTRDQHGMIASTAIPLSDDDHVNSRPVRRSRRTATRTSLSAHQYSEEESESDDELDVIDTGYPAARRSRRTISQMAINIDHSSDDSIVRPQQRKRKPTSTRSSMRASKRMRESLPSRDSTRRSERQRKPVRDMAERLEDDISSVEIRASGTKYAGAREQFVKVPKGPFRNRHYNTCITCSRTGDVEESGPLVFCQGCTYAYHSRCLGPRGQREHMVTKIDTERFVLQCKRCLGAAKEKSSKAPHHGHCSQCNEPGPLAKPLREKLTARQEQLQREENYGVDPVTTVDMSLIDNVANVMFRCVACERAWHMEHIPPKERRQSPRVQDGAANEDEDLAAKLFKIYSGRGECLECIDAPGIESLVAWRPVNLDSFVPGTKCGMLEENAKEYLVKWRNMSYFKTKWMPGAWVWRHAASGMRKALVNSEKSSRPKMTTRDAVPEDYLLIDIVLDVKYSNFVKERNQEIDLARIKEVTKVYAKYKGLQYEEVVWENPPKSQDTEKWQSFQRAYEYWVRRNYMHVPGQVALNKHLVTVRSKDFATQLVKHAQPSIMATHEQLYQYQLEGLNWIYYRWYKQQSAILADEMGLGKTIQVIAFLSTLIEDHHCWPFLVVVPNPTCPNWLRETRKWARGLQVVTYYGSAEARKKAYKYEMFPQGRNGGLRAHIVVTSYEAAVEEKARLASIPWAGLVVDEGHRLKNRESQLYRALLGINFPFKLILTGTPLQNNVRELFNILQFCDPSMDAEKLEEQYSEITNENVAEVHEMIRPFILRRTKAGSLDSLPPIGQIIVPVSMSIVQKKMYKYILEKDPRLKAVFTNQGPVKERANLNNILMQLRKCLCHPFVYSKAIEERGVSETLLHRNMVEASSKLQLLDILLPKLHERGHRVLIFSQFLDFLDIIEDFLDGLGLLHVRFDGSSSSSDKQKRIEAFNDENSPYFAFLLSTRSGGQGINLATADTVIIMDPDFNPHQDIQAMSRAHRIGQRKKVLVFQLMTKNSAEEKIMQIGRKKVVLDHVMIERMDAEDDAGEDVETILRHGADALYDNDDSYDVYYDSQSVEKLLDRGQIENTKVGKDSSAESQFSFARVWVNDSTDMQDDLDIAESRTANGSTWEKIMKDRERRNAEEARTNVENLGRGKRRRQEINYAVPFSPSNADATGRLAESDEEFHTDGSDVDSIMESAEPTPDGKRAANSGDAAMGRPYKRAHLPPVRSGPIVDGASDSTRQHCIVCDEFHEIGYCRLKLAGVEHCGLCGLGHYGISRACPHLNSESQVAKMLAATKESTEPRAIVEEARKYLRGVRGDLVRRKKNWAARAARKPAAQAGENANKTQTTVQNPQYFRAPPIPVQGSYPANHHNFHPPPVPVQGAYPPNHQNLHTQSVPVHGVCPPNHQEFRPVPIPVQNVYPPPIPVETTGPLPRGGTKSFRAVPHGLESAGPS